MRKIKKNNNSKNKCLLVNKNWGKVNMVVAALWMKVKKHMISTSSKAHLEFSITLLLFYLMFEVILKSQLSTV